MIRYLITKEETCPKCDGHKLVQHWAWVEFWENHTTEEYRALQDKDGYMEEWFEERGYMVESAPYMGQTVSLFPPEEVECSECRGTGIIRTEVNFQEVLNLLAQSGAINV